MSLKRGRDIEVEEIVTYKRALQVGLLLLGELDAPMSPVFPEMFLDKPRAHLKAERDNIRADLRGKLQRFCQDNFTVLTPAGLATLYQPLFDKNSTWILPLTEFVQIVGGVRGRVFLDTPPHATVHISLCGLKTEYPEHHLMNDLAISFNEVVRAENSLKIFEKSSMGKVKSATIRPEVVNLKNTVNMYRRTCVLACFNLLEAYLNGLAWEFVQGHDISNLSQSKKSMLTEASENIVKRALDIPPLVAERNDFALTRDREPIKSFVDIVKPYRDSIVHASPFGAPERFGGYDKLSKIYDLNIGTVNLAIGSTLSLISYIYKFIGGKGDYPSWVYTRNTDGTFNLTNK